MNTISGPEKREGLPSETEAGSSCGTPKGWGSTLFSLSQQEDSFLLGTFLLKMSNPSLGDEMMLAK